MFGCLSRADKPDIIASFRMNNNQQAILVRVSNQFEVTSVMLQQDLRCSQDGAWEQGSVPWLP
jgi:hypothetical protein